MEIKQLVEQLDNNDFQQVNEIVFTLVEMGDAINDCIFESLKDENREFVIRNLIRIIGLQKNSDKKFVELIMEYAKNSESRVVREASFAALEQIGDFAFVSETIKMLHFEEDSSIRESMINLIGELTTKYPVQILIERLVDEDSFVQEAAAEAILNIYQQPIQLLISQLEQTSSSEQKVAIIEVLRMTKSQSAITILQSMINDEDKNISYAAKLALQEINQKI